MYMSSHMHSSNNIEKNKRKLNKPLVSHGVSLVRWGGLGMVKQRGNYGHDTFHSAPERYGHYAFLFPFIELFLIGSTKTVEFSAGVRKEFHATGGQIWTHFKPDDPKDILAIHNDWYKVDVYILNKLIKKVFAQDSACIQTRYFFEDKENRIPWDKNKTERDLKVRRLNPYIMCSTDHMEVFVCRDTKIS